MPRQLTALNLVDLGPELAGLSDPWLSAACDGSIFAVARTSAESPVIEGRQGVFPKSRLQDPTDQVVVRWLDGAVERTTIRNEPLLLRFVQPTPDGLVAVAMRSRWRREGPEANAVVYRKDGRELRRFLLGDGINDVRTAPDGTLWVSYFDEGVFGNLGWGPPGPEPIGAPGLRAFAATGEPVFQFDAARAGTDTICDAYALNVPADGSAWVYFYTEFPIVQVRRDAYRAWKLGVRGAQALAVDGQRALLVGDDRRRSTARVVDLSRPGSARVVEELVLVDQGGAPLDDARAVAVGAEVFLFQGTRALVARGW